MHIKNFWLYYAEEVKEEEKITTQDLSEIEEAIEEIAKEKQFDIDKEELDDLKEDVEEYKEVRTRLQSHLMSLNGREQRWPSG